MLLLLGEEPGISGAAGELAATFSLFESVLLVGGRAGSAFLGAVALGSADIVGLRSMLEKSVWQSDLAMSSCSCRCVFELFCIDVSK